MLQTIFVSFDSVHIERTRDGLPAGGMRFALRDLAILDLAFAALGTSEPRAEHIGAIDLPSGVAIEVAVGYDAILFRTRLPSGERRGVTSIRGAELRALQRAVADLKHFVSKKGPLPDDSSVP